MSVPSRLAATSREPEEWAAATEGARQTREVIADQLRALVIEGDRMSGRAEVAMRVVRITEAERKIVEALGRAEQARELGLPIEQHREAEHEERHALRAAVMDLAVAAAGWVAALDHELGMAERGRPAAA